MIRLFSMLFLMNYALHIFSKRRALDLAVIPINQTARLAFSLAGDGERDLPVKPAIRLTESWSQTAYSAMSQQPVGNKPFCDMRPVWSNDGQKAVKALITTTKWRIRYSKWVIGCMVYLPIILWEYDSLPGVETGDFRGTAMLPWKRKKGNEKENETTGD